VAAVLAVAVVVAAAGQGSGATTASDRQQEIQAEIERLRGELDEVAADEAAALADLHVTQRRKAEEQAKLTEIDASVTAATAALDAAQSALDQAAAEAAQAQQRLEQARDQLEEARGDLRDQAVASFMRFGSGAEKLDVVLRAGSISELHDAKAFVEALAERQARVVAEFTRLEHDATDLEASAAAARSAAADRRNEVQTQTEALHAARAAQVEAANAAANEAAREQSLLDALAGQRSAYEDRIEQYQAESDRITEELRRRSSSGPRISGRGSLSSPLADPTITSTFGYRTHPIFGDRRLHTGLDFRASSGTPIMASRSGEVIFAGWRGGYGNCTIIDHGGGLATLYAHQSEIRVTEGDEVARGDVIGAAGSTGFATGPHLHFEVRVEGAPVDPLPYL
jgi:murein DD-endopeptidase MepM/ murein hydrolase activator NlpD